MTVPFQNIPQNLRVPLFYAEIDNSRANTATFDQRALIIAQITGDGTATANTPIICTSTSQAESLGGSGSMLHLMYEAYKANDSFGEVWVLPLADHGSGVAATGSIEFTAPPTASGTLYLYIGGQRVAVAVTSAMDESDVADALIAAITADTHLPVTAAIDGSNADKVNLTAKNKGVNGNDIDLRLNYLGTFGGEVTPTGLAATITAMASGATNPVLTTALTNCGDEPFDFIACPYTDTTSLNALRDFLNDSTGRWSWSKQLFGHYFAAYRNTVGNQTTFGNARNDQHGTVMGFNNSPTPNWILAAQITGRAAASLRVDPGLPLQTLSINGFQAPPLASRFTLSERNTLLFDGISTFTVGQDGTCYIENLITTYQKNAFDSPDDSYLQVETMFLIAYVLRRLKTLVTSQYGRKKLASDSTRVPAGGNVVTPKMIKSSLIAEYRAMEAAGYVQNSELFAQEVIVEKSTTPNRVNVLFPPTLIEQLRIFAVLFQFRNN